MSYHELHRRIEILERSYELQLAFAAQGVLRDADSKAGSELRALLTESVAALDGLASVARAAAEEGGVEPVEDAELLISALERDATTTGASLRLILARESFSSQLIDNLDASIHVRALLTDLFLLDELVRQPG